jgi:hypothetical protein
MRAAVLVAAVGLACHTSPAPTAMEARLAALESTVRAQAAEIEALRAELGAKTATRTEGIIQPPDDDPNAGIEARLQALERKTASLSVDDTGRELTFSDVNLHLESHFGTWAGLGNLVVGTDNVLLSPTHSVIIGTGNRVGGWEQLVLGRNNQAYGWDSLTTGEGNLMEGNYGAVLASRSSTSWQWGGVVIGSMNSDASQGAVVVGGTNNSAGCGNSVIVGGQFNYTSADDSAIVGGSYNYASGWSAVVIGGAHNQTDSAAAVAVGGEQNHASGPSSTVTGGQGRTVTGDYDWRAGDLFQEQ